MPRFGTCEIGSFLRRCKAQGVATCQYCGRTFCPEHGMFLEENQEICLREPCQAKRVDLEKHLVWKARAIQRSVAGHCGIDGCIEAPSGQCSKCRALFCTVHISERDQTTREGRTSVTKRVAMCEHCWQRRTIWTKV